MFPTVFQLEKSIVFLKVTWLFNGVYMPQTARLLYYAFPVSVFVLNSGEI